MDSLIKHFDRNGYCTLKNVLTSSELDFYEAEIDRIFTNANLDNNPSTANGFLRHGVVAHAPFWNLIDHPIIKHTVEKIANSPVKFLPHDSIFKDFSGSQWHRDCVNKVYGQGLDWESNEPYKLFRVAIYLEDSAQNKFRLGFIKKSHKRPLGIFETKNPISRYLQGLERRIARVFKGSFYFPFFGKCDYVAIKKGDVLIFDPKTYHRGELALASKHAIIYAYGKENVHFKHHCDYYYSADSDAQELPSKLAKKLSKKHLLANCLQ